MPGNSPRKAGRFAIEPVELVEVMDEFEKLNHKIEAYHPHLDKELIIRALRFAAVAHAGQRRKSGQPFIYHGIQTADILADLHLDSVMIASGLLHDVAEDTDITIEQVYDEFGEEIANIIDGLTKIAGLKLMSPEVQQAENFRKMILYTAKDLRTVMVKFADRLHNMRTLQYLPESKRKRIAHETLEVFAPLAHRFGMNNVKNEFEDLSFRWLHPRDYFSVKRMVDKRVMSHDDYFEQFLGPVRTRLETEGINSQFQWRMKHIYSIYKKMQRTNKNLDEIYDVFAVRIIVGSIGDCYHTLGIIHDIYKPVVERIKDYIATPKFNMYQSLHTTVMGPTGRLVEVQIRTNHMHETAETGIAAHWHYKEGQTKRDEIDSYMAWLRKVVDWQSTTPEPGEFMQELKMDLFQDEIFVFTPKGDLIQLPKGSTPIDFAFALHSEVGMHCAGSRVNERMVPLNYELKSGDSVEIITNSNKYPSPGWLHIVKTAKARSLIRRWIKRQRMNESRALGNDMLTKIEKILKNKIDEKSQAQLIEKFRQKDWDQFIVNLGSGDISLHSVQNYFGLKTVNKTGKHTASESKKMISVSVQGMDNLLLTYAKCCKPLPGDYIIGFITRGRGLVIHRSDCPNIMANHDLLKRAIDVDWGSADEAFFVATIRVEAVNRKNLLNDITAAIAKTNCNIRSARISTEDDIATDDFDVDVKDLKSLYRLMKEVRKVKNITRVTRLDSRSPEYLAEHGHND